MLTLVPSAARVAGTFVFPAVAALRLEKVVSGLFLLTVSAAAAGAGDTLNTYVQHSPDDGTTWDDFVSFTQVLGNGGAKKFQAQWSRESSTPETEIRAPADAALAAGGVLQGPVGRLWRAKAVVVGGTASFTFSLTLEGVRR